MEINNFLTTLEQATGRMRLKEITSAVETLKSNNSDLMLFLTNNTPKCSDFDIVSFLIEQQTLMLNSRIPLNLTKNIYDQYSIIFVICVLESTKVKSERNKLTKMFSDLLANSAKFDIYKKVNKNLKLSSSADSQMNELFWLIPLFSNVSVLTKIDVEKFIQEMKECSVKVNEFILGYGYYVTNNITNMDKSAYKLYLQEGLKLSKKQ